MRSRLGTGVPASYFCMLFCLVWPLPYHLNCVHRDGREPRPGNGRVSEFRDGREGLSP